MRQHSGLRLPLSALPLPLWPPTPGQDAFESQELVSHTYFLSWKSEV